MKLPRLTFLLLLLPGFSMAQLYIGPTAGMRLSTVTFFDERAKNDFKALPSFGFDAGLMVSRRIKERFCLNAQLMYTQKGKYIKGGLDSLPFEIKPDPRYRNKQTNRFIELPIYYMLEFKNSVGKAPGMAGKSRSYKWFVGGGPTISYWLGGKGALQSSSLQEVFVNELDYKIVFKKDNSSLSQTADADKMNVTDPNRFQFALNLTGGIALEPVGFQKIVIAAHVEIGQTFFSKGDPGYFPGSNVNMDVLKAKNHSLRISVSYMVDTKIEDRQRGKSTIKNKNTKKRKR